MSKQQIRKPSSVLGFRLPAAAIALVIVVVLFQWTGAYNIAHATESCFPHDYYGSGGIHMHSTDCHNFPSSSTCQSLIGSGFCWQIRVSMDTYVVVYQLAANSTNGFDSSNYGPYVYRMSTHTGPINNAHYTSTNTVTGSYDCGCDCYGGTCPVYSHGYYQYSQHFYYRTQADYNSGNVEGGNYDNYF